MVQAQIADYPRALSDASESMRLQRRRGAVARALRARAAQGRRRVGARLPQDNRGGAPAA